jgi:hypothetical protein
MSAGGLAVAGRASDGHRRVASNPCLALAFVDAGAGSR